MSHPSPENTDRDNHPLKNVLSGIFLLGLTFFLANAKEFILPLVVALFIAITFRPSIRILARRHIPEWLAAGGFLAAVILVVVGMAYMLEGPIASFVQNASTYSQTFGSKLQAIQSHFSDLMSVAQKIKVATQPADAAPAQEVVVRDNSSVAYLGQFTGYSMGVLASIVLTLVVAAYLMASGDLFYTKLVRVLPSLKDKKTALRIVYDVEKEVSSYLLTVTAINAGLGVAVAISFYALGMPSPLLWGLIAFIFNYIPFVGAIAGIGLSAFMAVVSFDSPSYSVLVPAAYALCNGIENQLVSPLFLGRRLRLNSVAILVNLVFWSWIWGVAGTLIAVPILVTIKVFCEHLEGMSGIGEFLSAKESDEQPKPPVASEALSPAAK